MPSQRIEQIVQAGESGQKVNPCLMVNLTEQENKDLISEINRHRNSGNKQFLPEVTFSSGDDMQLHAVMKGASQTCAPSDAGGADKNKEQLRDWNVAAVNGRDVTSAFSHLPESQKSELAKTISEGNAQSPKQYPLLSVEQGADGKWQMHQVDLSGKSQMSPELTKALDEHYATTQETARHERAKGLSQAIESAAKRDVVNDDEGAKLELRQRVAQLKNEDPRVVQDVLTSLQKDGSSVDPRKPPAAEIRYATDAAGHQVPSEIVFTSNLVTTSGKDTIPMNKSVEEQAAEARDKFEKMPVNGFTAGAKAQHDLTRDNGTLSESGKLWFERVPDNRH